jgi:hypothetical protein
MFCFSHAWNYEGSEFSCVTFHYGIAILPMWSLDLFNGFVIEPSFPFGAQWVTIFLKGKRWTAQLVSELFL